MSNDCYAPDCCNGDIPEEVVNNGHPTQVHMIVDVVAIACEVDINDGNNHTVSCDFKNVNCDGCRIKWLEYLTEQQKLVIADQKKAIETNADTMRVMRVKADQLCRNQDEREQVINNVRRELTNQNNANRRLVLERDRLRDELQAIRRASQGSTYDNTWYRG